jgi:hypothetical protein
MAKREKVAEEPDMATFGAEFHVTNVSTRMLANGNKVKVVLEGEYDVSMVEGMALLFDEDCHVTFEQLPKKVDDDDEGQLGLPGVGPS